MSHSSVESNDHAHKGASVKPTTKRKRHQRKAAAAFAGALSMALMVGVSTTNQGPVSAQTVGGEDYASEIFGDPWDYSNPEDQVFADQQTTVGIQNPTIANGQMSFDITGGSYFHMIWGGYPDSTPTNRDGALHPIDTARYNRIAMKVTASAYTPAGLRWYSCLNLSAACEGGMPITLEAGTHTYDLPISTLQGTDPWQGGAPISLRMIFSPYGPTHIDVDWIRLTNGSGPIDQWNGPVVKIEDPDITGGADYASMARNGDAWDFSSADDYLRLDNVAGAIKEGALDATNAGPTINDPGVTMKVPVAFSADDFHRATVHFTYDGELNLEDKVGGGQNARLMWRVAGTPLRKDGFHNQVSKDVVTFPGQSSFTVDLKTNPSVDVVDPRQAAPKVGWAGNAIEMFRFDPNEDRGARHWRVDNVKLADDDAGDTTFAIKLRDLNPAPGTSVSVFSDSDAKGFDGEQIASGVDLSGGTATVNWTPTAGTKGLFWIYTVTTRGGLTTRTYSTGPVRMGSPINKYTFGPVTGGPQGQINFGVKPGAPGSLPLSVPTTKPGKGPKGAKPKTPKTPKAPKAPTK
jgi:hypothetical protein